MHRPTRRDVLRVSASAAAALALPGSSAFARARRDKRPKPDFSAAFLTDMHVYDQKGAPQGFAKAVRNAFDRPHPPDLLVTGGDLAMDILATGTAEADAQYALFEAQIAGVKVPVHHTMGNHDMLGVYEKSGLDPGHPKYGKKYFAERYGGNRTYHSFDHEGWHFVILDTLGIRDREYIGWIDEEQQQWLEDDLAAAARPTVVIGHVPLLSNYVELTNGTKDGIPGGVSVVNAHQVVPILGRHPVKLVLAGHLHVNEVFRYKGIEYANVGAVSGNWWRGERDGFQEGYARLEFRGGEVSWEYVDYGWDVPAEAATGAAA